MEREFGNQNRMVLKCCDVCGKPKLIRIHVLGIDRVLDCACACDRREQEAIGEERAQRERAAHIRQLRAAALQDVALLEYTFERDDGSSPAMRYARRYAERWPQMKADGRGLLLWGGVGTGKTFAAASIVNAVVEQDAPALMTTFARVLNSLSGMYSEDRNRCLDSFKRYELLVIDDLGVERSTDYVMEQVYGIVNSRYLSRLPLIVTTNLTLDELKNPEDAAHARIYDRVLERCVPVRFAGESRRRGKAEENMRTAARLLGE